MPNRLSLLTTLLLAVATPVAAQSSGSAPTVSLSAAGLLSWHPVDDAAVGGPYLDTGLGGLGAGASVMVDVVSRSGLTGLVEASISQLTQRQSGRLVNGTDTGRGSLEGRLRDPMLSFLVGYTSHADTATGALVFGVALVDAVPSVGGRRIDELGHPSDDAGSRLGLVVGTHGRYAAGRRVSYLASARYVFVDRSTRARELGASGHIIRLGVGLSVALGR